MAKSIDEILEFEIADKFNKHQIKALEAHLGNVDPSELNAREKEIYEVVSWVSAFEFQAIQLPTFPDPQDIDVGAIPTELIQSVASIVGLPEPVVELVLDGLNKYACDKCLDQPEKTS
ncbi:MAG: hypothetical protein ABEN55_03825 [Bradymonadaceae bacterium]